MPIVGITYLDTVLFVNVAQKLMHHRLKDQKSFDSFKFKGLFLSEQCFLDFDDGFHQYIYLLSLVLTEFSL